MEPTNILLEQETFPKNTLVSLWYHQRLGCYIISIKRDERVLDTYHYNHSDEHEARRDYRFAVSVLKKAL